MAILLLAFISNNKLYTLTLDMQVDTVNHIQTKITKTDFNRNCPSLLLVPFIFSHVGQCACVPMLLCVFKNYVIKSHDWI